MANNGKEQTTHNLHHNKDEDTEDVEDVYPAVPNKAGPACIHHNRVQSAGPQDNRQATTTMRKRIQRMWW